MPDGTVSSSVRWRFVRALLEVADNVRTKPAILGLFVLYLSGYCALLAWFKWVDVYHLHFATNGLLVLIRNFLRALFIFYLFWIVYAAGHAALYLLTGHRRASVGSINHTALCFFAGTGLWHVLMLALGYLGLLTVPVAIAITVPAVVMSFPGCLTTLRILRDATTRWSPDRVDVLAVSITAVLAGMVLLGKGLFPSGGHDYFDHYFYYYQTVIQRGDLWPNEVWYHYFYSKGAGLFFLGILLTDPLAPQLVSCCFFFAGALAMALLVRRIAPSTRWPLASATILFGIFFITPGWGYFEKLHEFNTALVIAVLWLATEALEYRGQARLIWLFGAMSAIVSAVIINTQIGLYFIGLFGAMTVWYAMVRQGTKSIACAALVAGSGATVVSILAINYATTGLIIDQGILHTWKFADVEKLYHWGALPLVFQLHWGTLWLETHTFAVFSGQTFKLLKQCLRFDLLAPLIWGAMLLVAVALFSRRSSAVPRFKIVPGTLILLASAVLLVAVLAVAAGRAQNVSFYRYASFSIPLVIVLTIAIYVSPMSPQGRLAKLLLDARAPVVMAIFCLGMTVYETRLFRNVGVYTSSIVGFATGGLSLDNAFTAQGKWEVSTPFGGIHPGMRGVYSVAGSHTPVWSMHVQTYCMLPDCRMEGTMSFIMTPRWDELMFGSAAEGKKALQAAGVNNFVFSKDLALFDPLPLSALFGPDSIGENLGIRWTDGTTFLLTWAGPDTRPIDAQWLADYRAAIAASGMERGFPYAALKRIYEQLRSTPHPWRSFELPWERDRPI